MSSHSASRSLTPQNVQEAIQKSPDNGATLDFQHRNLIDISQEAVEELLDHGRSVDSEESSVCRMALGYNRLATLPIPFGLLSRLRYLNLKNNSFIVFPEVLTLMSSLEILDISRNKIKRFPADPGQLVSLRVLSIYRNKLIRLPAYLTLFKNLTVLKVEHNPIEWPPRSILESHEDLDDPNIMIGWLDRMREWLEENSLGDNASSPSRVTYTREADAEPGAHSSSTSDDIGDDDSFIEWAKMPTPLAEFDSGVTPHARSFSVDSDASISSNASSSAFPESLRRVKSPTPANFSLPPSTSSSPGVSPVASFSDPYPPADSTGDDSPLEFHDSMSHIRNASDAGGITSPRKIKLFQKKSLPDLRTAKVNFGREVVPAMPSHGMHSPGSTSPSYRPGKDLHNTFTTNTLATSRPGNHPATSMPSAECSAPPMDAERNSYFRRLSTLPSSTIARAIPQSLLALIDAVRGILFALSQIYQSLQHYTVFAIDDRLASVLLKVLDPASTNLGELIEALDRFDSVSRKGIPFPDVCRGVVASCRENVSVFGKAVAVLSVQLKVLATRDDARYTRQMLLVLYGAMGEISHSWQTISANMEAVRPLLHDQRPLPFKSGQTNSTRLREGPEALSGGGPSIPRSQSAQQIGHVQTRDGRSRATRRQGGSFSTKDLHIGASLPYKAEPLSPVSSPGVTVRSGARPFPNTPLSGLPPQVNPLSPHLPPPTPRLDLQSRQASPSSSVSAAPLAPLKVPAFDSPNSSSSVIDKKAIDAMDLAVRAAPAVWDTMDAVLSDDPDPRNETRDLLSAAQTVTQQLQDNIRAVQEGSRSVDRKTLREDAHTFVKVVVQLSSIVKSWAQTHPLSSRLRHNIQKLTDATQEFVILLHVSSFSPAATPRPYSPMVAPLGGGGASASQDESKLGAPLSRNRSAQPVNGKLAQATSKEQLRGPQHTNFMPSSDDDQ